MNIYNRINEVRKQCAFIKKDKKIEGGGSYMAISHDAVTAELRPHLVEQGIVIVPRLMSSNVVLTEQVTSKNIPYIRYEAKYEIDFVNCDEPTDRVTVPIESHAMDQGDKAPGKAASYATKYAMLKLFSIETGDSEEGREETKMKQGKTVSAQSIVAANVKPTAGLREQLTAEQLKKVDECASNALDCLNAGYSADEALKIIDEFKLDTDEAAALTTFFDSTQRTAMRKAREAQRAAKPERDPSLHRRDQPSAKPPLNG
jgi:hypothetical protein